MAKILMELIIYYIQQMISSIINKQNSNNSASLYPISKKALFFPTHSAILSLSKNNCPKKSQTTQYPHKEEQQSQIKKRNNQNYQKLISSSRLSVKSGRQSNQYKKNTSTYFHRQQKKQVRIISTNHFLNLQVKGKKSKDNRKNQFNTYKTERMLKHKAFNQGVQIINTQPNSFQRYKDKGDFFNYNQYLKTSSPLANQLQKDQNQSKSKLFIELKSSKSINSNQNSKSKLISVKRLEEFYQQCLKDLEKNRQRVITYRRKSIQKIRQSTSNRLKNNKIQNRIDKQSKNKQLYVNQLRNSIKQEHDEQMMKSQVLVNNNVTHKKLRLMSANSIFLKAKQLPHKKKNLTITKKPILNRIENSTVVNKVLSSQKDIIQGWQIEKEDAF